MACPSGFTLITEPVRGCGRAPGEAATCKSVAFSSGGQSYSHVCGRVNTYQKGSTGAFDLQLGARGLEVIYVDVISLTHGTTGSRQHIWTFAAAVGETPDYLAANCAGTDTERDWPYEVFPTLATTISVLQATQDLQMIRPLCMLMTPCGMERGVVLLMPAVNSTTLHGSAQHYRNLPQLTSK